MNLTKREREVLRYFALTIEDMATRLAISESTIKTHINNIFLKYSPHKTRTGILIEALRRGDVKLEEIVTE